MGLSGLEPPTSRLSGVRSNQLSYKPLLIGGHLLSHAVSSICLLYTSIIYGALFCTSYKYQDVYKP